MYGTTLAAALLLPPAHGIVYDSQAYWSSAAAPYTTQCYSITAELGPNLSPAATVVLPGNSSYQDLEIRASSPRISPTFSAVVEVATEQDVQHTVCSMINGILSKF